MAKPSEAERFWPKVNKAGPIPEYAPQLGPCWIWTAGSCKGYGTFVSAITTRAHRWSYITEYGPVAHELDIDHLCRVTLCMRPSHLEAVPHRVNMLRSPIAQVALNAQKTHCQNGHDFSDPEVTTVRINKNGHPYRVCRKCAVDHVRKWRNRRRAAGLPIK